MALSERQKNALDNVINNHLTEIANLERFTSKQILSIIANDVDFALTVQSIVPSLNRVCSYGGRVLQTLPNSNEANRYKIIIKDYVLTGGFKKEKNLLVFELSQGNNFTYDFITKTFSDDLEKVYFAMDNFEKFLKYEWLFNYVSDFRSLKSIYEYCTEDMYKECPAGLINFLNEKGWTLTPNTLKEFYLYSKYGTFGTNFINAVGENLGVWMLENNLAKEIVKIATNTIKKGNLNINPYPLTDIIYKLSISKIPFSLDNTKGISDNVDMLKTIYDASKNEMLKAQLQRLNFINGKTNKNNNLIIVVPQSQEEKQDEGKQQHNCVGYHYDESIIKGQNLIFFIRKADTPKKSYVTCRYNIASQDVVEYRTIYNNRVSDTETLDFIEEIGQVIRENLS